MLKTHTHKYFEFPLTSLTKSEPGEWAIRNVAKQEPQHGEQIWALGIVAKFILRTLTPKKTG